MSFDIVIATRTPPTRGMVESHLRDVGWRLSLEGDLGGDDANLMAESRGLLRRKHVFVLSGPFPAEQEDLPDPVQQVIRGRAFLSEMNLRWGLGDKDMSRAFALCEHLALTCDGAVFNPQDDALVFPDVSAKPRRREPVMTPVRQLTLEWYLPTSSAGNGARFLEIVRRVMPEALPSRFGLHEPLRFKLADPTGEAEFLALWQPTTWLFFWKSKKPVFGGSVGWSPDRPAPPGKRPKVEIHIDINATAIENDPATCDRVVEMFVTVAEELGAFYAAGYVTRGVLTGTRGAQWYGQGTENFAFDWINGPWWIGLPPKATWLTWFGPPYQDLVAPTLDGHAVQREHGLLVRLGSKPMDSDEIRSRTPALPNELLAGMSPVYGKVAMQDTGEPMVLNYERSPAELIPPFD
ncbi:MAG: hypothetical protein QOF11_1098 [Chloroflexota bacterium]|nr:hypothetical protein [Chloroflexota bacterium]